MKFKKISTSNYYIELFDVADKKLLLVSKQKPIILRTKFENKDQLQNWLKEAERNIPNVSNELNNIIKFFEGGEYES